MAFELGFQSAGDWRRAGVAQLGLDGEVSLIERRSGEVRGDCRKANFHGTGRAEGDFAPESHVLVGRRGIPINPIDAQVFLGLRDGFDGEHVRPVAHQQRTDVELVRAISARDVMFSRDSLAVEPDIGAVVDAGEIQPHALAFESIRRAKFGAIPP